MKAIITLLALAATLALTACTQPPRCYPISGQPCAPDDPVHHMRADYPALG